MFTQTTIFALAALSTVTSAITVTNPNRETLWNSAKSNSITWTSVSTDPGSFDIYLSHMVGGSPPLNTLLFADVSSDKGSVVVEGLQFPTGDAYRVNFVAHNKPEQIYAQSNQFNVTGEAVKATSTVEGYTGPTYAPSATKDDEEKTTAKDTTLVTSTGTNKPTETASGTESKTKTNSAESTETTKDSSEAANATKSSESSGTNASVTPTSTPNAAVGNVATGSLAAFVFGAIALFA